MILISSATGDVHARRVAQEIREQGYQVAIVDFGQAGREFNVSLSFMSGERRIVTSALRGRVEIKELGSVQAIWNRRPSPPRSMPNVLDWESRQFAALEWRYFVDSILLEIERDSFAVSRLQSQRAALKPYQLDIARRVGLKIPETLVTSDPTEAAKFVDAHNGHVIHKTINSASGTLLETRQWKEEDRRWLSTLQIGPTIFQERIDGCIDVRATIVGGSIFSALIESKVPCPHPDSRLNSDVSVQTYRLSEPVACSLLALMKELDLHFATADLKMTRSGELVFLELNPQGQFLYIEILTDQPIAAALANLLCRPSEGLR